MSEFTITWSDDNFCHLLHLLHSLHSLHLYFISATSTHLRSVGHDGPQADSATPERNEEEKDSDGQEDERRGQGRRGSKVETNTSSAARRKARSLRCKQHVQPLKSLFLFQDISNSTSPRCPRRSCSIFSTSQFMDHRSPRACFVSQILR